MIYALNTRDVSDHERREIARRIRDGQDDALRQDEKIVLVRDIKVGEGRYYCIYCMEKVHKFWLKGQVSFHHGKEGCIGSDKGLPGIRNPVSVTIPGHPDE